MPTIPGGDPLKSFKYPVGILLFNRPNYARRILSSLRRQTHVLDQQRCVVVVDGYPGSKDERRGAPDLTDETAALVAEYLPRATLVRHESNHGIARVYSELETQLFSQRKSEWVLFLEEDFELHERYLHTIADLIRAVDDAPDIGAVSATGDCLAPGLLTADVYAPMNHLWAYALRRSAYDRIDPYVTAYLECTSGQAYFERDAREVHLMAASMGLLLPGTSQDYLRRAAFHESQLLLITTRERFGTYIGELGEHSTPEFFRDMGYHDKSRDIEGTKTLTLPAPDIRRLQELTRIAFAREFLSRVTIPYLDLIAEAQALASRAESVLSTSRDLEVDVLTPDQVPQRTPMNDSQLESPATMAPSEFQSPTTGRTPISQEVPVHEEIVPAQPEGTQVVPFNQ